MHREAPRFLRNSEPLLRNDAPNRDLTDDFVLHVLNKDHLAVLHELARLPRRAEAALLLSGVGDHLAHVDLERNVREEDGRRRVRELAADLLDDCFVDALERLVRLDVLIEVAAAEEKTDRGAEDVVDNFDIGPLELVAEAIGRGKDRGKVPDAHAARWNSNFL